MAAETQLGGFARVPWHTSSVVNARSFKMSPFWTLSRSIHRRRVGIGRTHRDQRMLLHARVECGHHLEDRTYNSRFGCDLLFVFARICVQVEEKRSSEFDRRRDHQGSSILTRCRYAPAGRLLLERVDHLPVLLHVDNEPTAPDRFVPGLVEPAD